MPKILIEKIEKLKKSEIGNLIRKRIKEFKEMRKKSSIEIFNEMCFCILTANSSAERAMLVQKNIGDGFFSLPEEELAEKLKQLGYRFPNKRTEYIACARRHYSSLKSIFEFFDDENELRNWFVYNVKGFGYKEASHFLRNIGYENFAIVDFHIIDILSEYRLIEKPKNKSLSRKKYIEIENVLKEIGKKVNLNLAELDLYLWSIETGKVLK